MKLHSSKLKKHAILHRSVKYYCFHVKAAQWYFPAFERPALH